jgi:hypothetical protein
VAGQKAGSDGAYGQNHSAQFVKPYVKSNKNDLVDAAAIAEAVTRPSMRFVTPKSTEQLEIQTLHRIRDRIVGSKTQLINQIRAFCPEFGIASRQGVGIVQDRLSMQHWLMIRMTSRQACASSSKACGANLGHWKPDSLISTKRSKCWQHAPKSPIV